MAGCRGLQKQPAASGPGCRGNSFDDSDEAEIRRKFASWQVADAIRRAGNRLVVVDHGGPKVLGEETESNQ